MGTQVFHGNPHYAKREDTTMDIGGGYYDLTSWKTDPEKRITSKTLAQWIDEYGIENDPWVPFFRKILSINFPPSFFLVMPWLLDQTTLRFWVQGGVASPYILFVEEKENWGTAQVVYVFPSSWKAEAITEDSLRKGITETLNEEREKAKASLAKAQEILTRANHALEALGTSLVKQ